MQLQFNAFDYDPSQSGGICFPLADYKVEITAAEQKPSKNNPANGLLELTFTVLDGELRGLTHAYRMNIYNTNEVAKKIAHNELAAVCFAINRPYIQDSDQLLGGRLLATIGPQDNDPKYSEVKLIKCPDGSMPTRPQQAAAPVQAPPQPPQPQPAAPPQPPPQPPPQAPPATAAPAQAPPWNGAPAAPAAPAWAAQVPPPPTNAQAVPGAVPPWAKQ